MLFSQLAQRLYERFPRYFDIFYFTRRCLRVDSNKAISSVRVTLLLPSSFYLALSTSHPYDLVRRISRFCMKTFANEMQELPLTPRQFQFLRSTPDNSLPWKGQVNVFPVF